MITVLRKRQDRRKSLSGLLSRESEVGNIRQGAYEPVETVQSGFRQAWQTVQPRPAD
jgi:hypothetical protein